MPGALVILPQRRTEGILPGDEPVGCDPQRVHVIRRPAQVTGALGVPGAALEQPRFGRTVGRRPRRQALPRQPRGGWIVPGAEVHQHRPAVRTPHPDIVALDVPVHRAPAVRGLERPRQLRQNLEHLPVRRSALAGPFIQRGALHPGHDDEGKAGARRVLPEAVAEQARDARVMEERQQPHLPHESRIPGEQRHLERHRTVSLPPHPEGAVDDARGAMSVAVHQQPLLHPGARRRTEVKPCRGWIALHEVSRKAERNLLPLPVQAYLIRRPLFAGRCSRGNAHPRRPAGEGVAAPQYTPIYQVDREPEVTSEVKIPYPEEARRAGIEGTVTLSITIDPEGKVVAAKIISGPGYGLNEAARDAIKRFRFKPAVKGGEPVSTEMKYSYTFVLD